LPLLNGWLILLVDKRTSGR